MVVPYVDDAEVSEKLSTDDAIECVGRAFRLLAVGDAVNAPRRRSHIGAAQLNVMWALAPTVGLMGVKSYPVVKSDVTKGTVLTLLVYDIASGELLAMMKADRLGQIRTGAATAVGAQALARPDSTVLSLFGTGYQAETQLRSVASVLPQLKSVRVVGRNAERRDRFIAYMAEEFEIELRAEEAESAVRAADVVVTATGSTEPLFDGAWVRAGTHISAVGSNAATKRELDRTLLDRASLIVVDDQEVAALECGDLLMNGYDPTLMPTLGEVLVGTTAGRRGPEDVTVFESQGLAIQDVVCAAHVLQRVDLDQ